MRAAIPVGYRVGLVFSQKIDTFPETPRCLDILRPLSPPVSDLRWIQSIRRCAEEKQGRFSLQKPRVVRGDYFGNLGRRVTDRHLVGPLVERVSRTPYTSPGFSLEPEG